MASRLPYPFGNPTALVSSTTAQTGTWAAILALENTVLSTLTMIGNTQDGTWASVALAAGAVIQGAFTNFTLTSGAVLAYDDKVTSS